MFRPLKWTRWPTLKSSNSSICFTFALYLMLLVLLVGGAGDREAPFMAGVVAAQHQLPGGVVGTVASRGELCHPACRGRCVVAAVVHAERLVVVVVADDLGLVEHDGVVVDLEA